MKYVKWFFTFALAALIVIQFFPTEKNVHATIPANDFLVSNNAPPHIVEMIHTACYDCHSNNTRYPWYNKLQPAAWFLEGHVKEGKEEMNLNEWTTFSEKEKIHTLKHIKEAVKEGWMPLKSYKFIHKDARLTEAQRQEISTWLRTLHT